MGAFTLLARELGDLKRLRDATASGSLAERLFRSAWARLESGESGDDVALSTVAAALAACRLAGIAAVADRLPIEAPDALLRRGFDEVAGPIAPDLRARLREAAWPVPRDGSLPQGHVAERLIRQPRAGATCPGKPRIVLDPPESHGDHCLVVAALGTVLAGHYGADPAIVFLAGLAHHLHNGRMPDAGFAGEVLLGDALNPLIAELFESELQALPGPAASELRRGLTVIGDAGTPEGRAFNAADVIDRVLQMHHYARAAAFTVSQATDDLELVHAGPLQAFHHDVLREADLA